MRSSLGRLAALIVLTVALTACGSRGHERPPQTQPDAPAHRYEPLDGPPNVAFDVDALPELVPRDEPLARYGNHSPYEVLGKRYKVLPRSAGYVQRGTASWYGTKFHGRLTSTREPYDMYQFSAAHKTLPLPSYARVTRLDNGKSVIVRINDRGPFVGDRLIDLSYAAAVKLGVHLSGTAPVEVRVLHAGDDVNAAKPTPRKPEQPSVVGSRGAIYLQVGAFSARANAFAYRRRLLDAGFAEVRVFTARTDRGRVWRVRVGPLGSLDQADDVRARLRSGGFGEPRVLHQP
ncbi:MAG TPA: septal ring lytic transglycosylase RlpA family protein [Xanthomonadales bacterium]|nr:septal ring lytic transglycosylase RlpA family protein [Xanthomonadales bacterium]